MISNDTSLCYLARLNDTLVVGLADHTFFSSPELILPLLCFGWCNFKNLYFRR